MRYVVNEFVVEKVLMGLWTNSTLYLVLLMRYIEMLVGVSEDFEMHNLLP